MRTLLRITDPRSAFSLSAVVLLLLALSLFVSGCATRSVPLAQKRSFSFQQDTFAYANELKWEYHFEPDGKWTGRRREPQPDYALHCFVVARSCRQFFDFAQFDPQRPKADDATYAKLVRKIVHLNPRHSPSHKIVVPGYANLREFSEEHESLLKEECGGAWQSYFQRGNWRMVFPFSRNHQDKMADQFARQLAMGKLPVAHVVRFPDLSINHAVVIYDAKPSATGTTFRVYDPNQPEAPTQLIFDRATHAFVFPRNNYFAGGAVNVYEIYCSLLF